MKTAKKRLLSILLALTLVLGVLPPVQAAGEMVAIDETNFPDAVFRSYVAENFDTDGDNQLSEAERMEVTLIAVEGQWDNPGGITSLEGIAFFPALTTLYCQYNNLTSLDVSKNTALTDLNCANNSLTSLDISQNAELEQLICTSNQLTSLDVSQNAKMEILWCYDNQLTSLDVSQNTALLYLTCYSNKLTSLDVSKNTDLWGLCCDYNNLVSLEVGGSTALSDLQCDSNALTSLDVSGCTALTNLECNYNNLVSLDVSGCTALTNLRCDYNDLVSLDVSGSTTLADLRCYNNKLTSLNVDGCTALDFLSCDSNRLTSLDVSGCTALTDLDCYTNQLASLDVSGCTALTDLDCANNSLASLDISGCTALTDLNCHSNQLTSLDVSKNTALTELICHSNQLTSLDLSQNANLDYGSFGVQARTISLSEDNTFDLSQLPGFDVTKASDWVGGTVSGNILTADADAVMVTYSYDTQRDIPLNVKLELEGKEVSEDMVAIDETNFPDEVFRSYVSENFDTDGDNYLSVAERNEVTYIDVSNSNVGSLEGIAFFPALTSLFCSSNRLESLDVSKNAALTTLWCDQNQLTSLDVSKNAALTNLLCDSNQLTSLDVSKNTALEELYCRANQLTSLEVNGATALKKLECAYNRLTSLDVSGATALWELNCSDNQLTNLKVSGADALGVLRCYNNQLTDLDVSKNTELEALYCLSNQLTSLDVGKNTALTTLLCGDNQLTCLDLSQNTNLNADFVAVGEHIRTISVTEDNTFDLSQLPGFDVTKASHWVGGMVSGSVLTVEDGATEVTYTYDTGSDYPLNVTLKITAYSCEESGHKTQLEGVKEATCTEDGYTGDLVCTVCGEIVERGEVVKATGHKYADGVCTECGAKNYVDNVQVPTVNPEKPVDEVQAGVSQEQADSLQEQTNAIIESILKGENTDAVSQEDSQKIAKALEAGKKIDTVVEFALVSKEAAQTEELELLAEKLNDGETLAQVFDLSVAIKVEGETLGHITKLENGMEITLAVPAGLLQEGREFFVLRIHNGEAEKLDAVLNENGTITFVTDRFSTYALGVKDAGETVPPTTEETTETTPVTDPEGPAQTGDSTNIALLSALLVISAMCLVVVTLKTRKVKV